MNAAGTGVVIVGSGLAGISVARELRKLDAAVPIRIVTADSGGFYSKPNLSNALAAGKTATQLMQTPREALEKQLSIRIDAGVRVTHIRLAGGLLETSAGSINYEKLVLASGAQPIRLPIAGDGAAAVLSVNHIDDYAVFREKLASPSVKRVAILGAGLIGSEFANDLRSGGFEVEVFDIAPQALGRLLPAQAAAFMRQRLEAAGVKFHFGVGATTIEHASATGGSIYRLTDSAGSIHAVDLVLSAVGLKPDTRLAVAAGLAVNRGIVTDRQLRCRVADARNVEVFAVGDCAEVEGLNLPYVMPIMAQARALAKTLAGVPTDVAYPAMPVVVKTPACPTVICPPPSGVAGDWQEDTSAEGVRAVFTSPDGSLRGFALCGAAMPEKSALAARLPALL
ncbi:MAG: FAD-dependent oxidoreductase [Sulfuritalea sp.]|nr:FAD-dependent oxidoreductase [Sulfuritalea sp.]